jgi:hypothetical protein
MADTSQPTKSPPVDRAEVVAVAAALARLNVPDPDDLSDRQQDALRRYARRLAVAAGIS